jgi:hypothetical protein
MGIRRTNLAASTSDADAAEGWPVATSLPRLLRELEAALARDMCPAIGGETQQAGSWDADDDHMVRADRSSTALQRPNGPICSVIDGARWPATRRRYAPVRLRGDRIKVTQRTTSSASGCRPS